MAAAAEDVINHSVNRDSLTRPNMTCQRLIIISDAMRYGDDAVAIAMLLADKSVCVEGIIATSGNVWADQATENICELLNALGRDDIKLYAGEPLSYYLPRQKIYQQEKALLTRPGLFHGALADLSTAHLAENSGNRSFASDGVDFLLHKVLANPGKISLVVLAPAAVLALAMDKKPEFLQAVSTIYISGGLINLPGNAGLHSELNFWFDPPSIDRVLRSAEQVLLMPLDVSDRFALTQSSLAKISRKSSLARYLSESPKFSNDELRRIGLWDAVTAAVVIDESVITESRLLSAEVTTTAGADYGRLRLSDANDSTAKIKTILSVSKNRVEALIKAVLAY